MKKKVWSAARYALMPELLPRIKDLFFSGFGNIAAMMAQVYGAVRLLPADHPYLSPVNAGRFGIRHVMVEAHSRLKYDWSHTDQVILFYTLMAGYILLIAQFGLLLAAFFIGGAFAEGTGVARPSSWGDFFVTPEPQYDIAFMLLDRVFGFDGDTGHVPIFNSSALVHAGVTHDALHALFKFYNTGILAVAMILLLYFLMVIVAETAQSGTPFGRRFNKAWAPIRMIVAIGLLTPLMWGMNGAQLLTLYVAKWGSSAATNGWYYFMDNLQDSTPAGPRESLMVRPANPTLSTLIEFLFVAKTCVYAEYYTYGRDIDGYLVHRSAGGVSQKLVFPGKQNNLRVSTMKYKNTTMHPTTGLPVKTSDDDGSKFAVEFTNNNDLRLVFGERPAGSEKAPPIVGDDGRALTDRQLLEMIAADREGTIARYGRNGTLVLPPPPEGQDQLSDNAIMALLRGQDNQPITGENEIRPICGELLLPIVDTEQPASVYMQQQYWEDLIPRIWSYLGDSPKNQALRMVPNAMRNPTLPVPWFADRGGEGSSWEGGETCPYNRATMVGEAKYLQCMVDYYISRPCPEPNTLEDNEAKCAGGGYVTEARKKQLDDDSLWEEEFRRYGWAGAAIWYNKIAEMNGAFIGSVHNLPRPVKYPEVMEYVAQQKAATDANMSASERFRPYRANGDRIDFLNPNDAYFAVMYYQAQSYFAPTYHEAQSNVFVDVMRAIFGLDGLFSMRDNADVHPLAQLVGVGKSLIDSTVNNLGFAMGAGVIGGLGAILGVAPIETVGFTGASFAIKVAMIGLTMGFILFYVVPFLPFIYYFFAVGTWVKSIFEAMVGLPLWAIAHLRIDGEGLPGPKAMGGYYLIFDIFIRPMMILFGLIAGIIVFAAQVQILNEVWDLVTDNLTGHVPVTAEGIAAAEARGTTVGSQSPLETIRGMVDQFFYTVLYAIVVYMIGLSSFKLIDLMPNATTRWLGSNAQTFAEHQQDPAQKILSQMYMGTNMVVNENMGAMGGLLSR